jgi:ABC-type bacteriocin/lantibiotic exporter with double-glycine peptidase domain
MTFISIIIPLYAVILCLCVYTLRRKLDEKNERTVPNQSISDQAKETLQSIKRVDQKELNRQDELGMLLTELMKAQSKLNRSNDMEDRKLSVNPGKIKDLERD